MGKKRNNPYKTLMYTKEMFEHWALEILKRYNVERYSNLAHVGGNSSPDLQTPSLSIGVEVTCAYSKTNMKIESYLGEYMGELFTKVPQRVLDDLSLSELALLHNSGRVDACYKINDNSEISEQEQIKIRVESISKKTQKLNSSNSYKKCRQYELFLFLYRRLDVAAVETIIKAAQTIPNDNGNNFECIYILSDDFLYECKQNSIICQDITEIKTTSMSIAYKNSGMESVRAALLKEQGYI